MKALVLGLGFVGAEVAAQLIARRHRVMGTTTTPAKIERMRERGIDATLLTSDDVGRMAALAHDCDAVVVTVGPNLARAAAPATRDEEYRRTLVVTCLNAAAIHPRPLFASSLSVYGAGGIGDEPIREGAPLSDSQHASPRNYRAAEYAILARPAGCVLRLPDVYGGAGDLSYVQRLELGHRLMGGTVPFSAGALLYRIHVKDAAAALVHALECGLTGVYNTVLDTERPPANRELFDRLAEEAGLPRLRFSGAIALPERPISGRKLAETGFVFHHTGYQFA